MKALGWIALVVGAYLFYEWYESSSTASTTAVSTVPAVSTSAPLLSTGTVTGTAIGSTPIATPAQATASGMQIGSPAWVAATSVPGSAAWVKAQTVGGGVPNSPDATVALIMVDNPKLSYAQAVTNYNSEPQNPTAGQPPAGLGAVLSAIF